MKTFIYTILINFVIFSFLPLLHYFFHKPPSQIKPIQVDVVKIKTKKIELKRKSKSKAIKKRTLRKRAIQEPKLKRRITFELNPNILINEADLIGVTYDLGEVDRLPHLIEYIEPDYPPNAIAKGAEGVVILKVLIDQKGKVVIAKVLSHGGFYEFGQSARRVIKRWRFEPAEIMGVPVMVWCTQAVRFKIKKR